MIQWLTNLPPYETYLIAVPSIMLGSVLLVWAIVSMFESRDENDGDARFR
jgi:hypothetical protein